MGPRLFGRGRIGQCRSGRKSTRPASMGPRPFGRGRRDGGPLLGGGRDASMGPRPFGRGRGSLPTMQPLTGSRGFNGAATFRSRKAGAGGDRVERAAASMGPRPFGRGRVPSIVTHAKILGCFNGAATFRSRKAAAPPRRRQIPRKLQWGRDLSVAEGWSHEFELIWRKAASMGPRPFGRGRDAIDQVRQGGIMVLQWGRDLSVAEGTRVLPDCDSGISLQWGRDLSVAEG